jgi:hypothetical protein
VTAAEARPTVHRPVLEQNGGDTLRCRLVDVRGRDEVTHVPGAQPQALGLLARPGFARVTAEPDDVHRATICRSSLHGERIPGRS